MKSHLFIVFLLMSIVLLCAYIYRQTSLKMKNERYSSIVYEAGGGPLRGMNCQYTYDDHLERGCCVNSTFCREKDWDLICNEKCQDKSQKCKIDACVSNRTLGKCLNSAPDCDPEVIKQKCNTRCDDKSQKCKIDACINSNSLDKCSNAAPDCDPEVIRKKFLQAQWKTFCAYTLKATNVDKCVRKGVESNQGPGAGFDASTSSKGSKIGCKGIYC
jgi:hypothetical protein